VILTTASGVITRIPVTFAVSSSPLGITPANLVFVQQNGPPPPAQTLQITGSQSFSAGAATSGGGNWLSVTPLSGVGKTTLTVSVNTANITPGVYNGTITLTPASGQPQTVPVTLNILAPGALTATPTSVAFAYTAGNPAPAAQTVSVTLPNSSAVFTASASGGSWLSVSPLTAATPATLTLSVDPTGLSKGLYNGSIALSSTNGTVELTIPVSLTVVSPLPVIDHVANGASYKTGGIAPGEIVSIFGSSLGPTTGVGATVNSKGYIGTTLGNVTVTFNGYPAPILYAGMGQINTIVPYELAGSSDAAVEVIFAGVRSNTVALPVVAAAPGIFSADASGTGPGAILDLNYHLVSASNPVSAGDVIQIFATGQGQTNPGGVDGLIEPISLPLPYPLLPAGVTIGGAAATIQYIGAAPGLVAGALQVNAFIPDGLPSGPATLFLSFGGTANSQAGITVAIH